MDITDIDIRRSWCKESMLNYTRYTFKHKAATRFVVGEHHRIICGALDAVVRGEIKRLIINIAPRYSKTELVSKSFVGYGLALNPRSRFLHLSYSDDLVLENSKEINEMVRSDYYQELFPEVVVESTNSKKWYTTAGGGLYAVATGGQVTGFGAGQMDKEQGVQAELDEFMSAYSTDFAGAVIIDDPIKPEDALSDVVRERVNRRFENTIRSRVNSRNTPIIIVMQRLHERDLCGYLEEQEPGEWVVISLPCLTIDEDGNEHALWEHKHTVEELHQIERVSPCTFETQYQQNPTPLEGLMYTSLKEYDTLPTGGYAIKNYTDTADTGADFLCSICYAEFSSGDMYLLDILYTDKPMEYTEPQTARMLANNAVELAWIESNNGGRGFARNVERNLRELGNTRTAVKWFAQTGNKQVRIFSHSAAVQNMIHFPKGWKHRWPEFATAVCSYRKEGRNAHDDVPDTITGMVERITRQNTTKYSRT